MQFLVTAYDYKDGGLERRLRVREQHVALGDTMRDAGQFLYGVALLDEEGQMRGSVMVMDFPSRQDLDTWLKAEPYVVNKVWETVEVVPCRVGPSFTNSQ